MHKAVFRFSSKNFPTFLLIDGLLKSIRISIFQIKIKIWLEITWQIKLMSNSNDWTFFQIFTFWSRALALAIFQTVFFYSKFKWIIWLQKHKQLHKFHKICLNYLQNFQKYIHRWITKARLSPWKLSNL